MKILRSMLFNAALLTAFLYGSMGGPEGFLYIALFILWLTAIGGVLLNSDSLLATIGETLELPVPYWLSASADAIMLVALVFFGHWFLGLFYMAHMVGVYNTYNYFDQL